MIAKISIAFLLLVGFQIVHLVNADYRNFKQDDISLIRNKLLTNITVEERALLQNAHPVMVLAVNKCNETISNIIEVYLQTFDPVLVSDETCSTSLRNEAWRFLRKTSKSGFYCLNQLNSQLLATSRINKFMPLTDCLANLEKESIEKLKIYVPTVKLCSYFLAIPVQSVNLDPTGITKAIRKSRILSD